MPDGAQLTGYAAIIIALATLASSIAAAFVSVWTLLQAQRNAALSEQNKSAIADVHKSVNGKMEEIKSLYQARNDQNVSEAIAAGDARLTLAADAARASRPTEQRPVTDTGAVR